MDYEERVKGYTDLTFLTLKRYIKWYESHFILPILHQPSLATAHLELLLIIHFLVLPQVWGSMVLACKEQNTGEILTVPIQNMHRNGTSAVAPQGGLDISYWRKSRKASQRLGLDPTGKVLGLPTT